ncbi:MAG: SbmA/BacA-like family transporter [Pseudomonadales bacterium]
MRPFHSVVDAVSKDNSPQPATKPRARRHFFRQFMALCGPYWRCQHYVRVRSFTLLFGLLTLAQVGLAIWTTYWNRELFDSLEQRSLSQFVLQIGEFIVIFVLTMAVTGAHLYVKRWLQLDWRAWMSARLLDRWMNKGRHYQLLYTEGEHDNPDGRIAEDIRVVTEMTISLVHTLFYSILVLFSFIDILLDVSGSFTVPGTNIGVSGYMVWMAFLYAGVGAAVGSLLGNPLVKATDSLQTSEADFRFGLSRAREHTEAIVLMQGERAERKLFSQLFASLTQSWNKQTMAYAWIVSYSTGYGALLPVFPLLIAAPQYIAGAMTLGVLMQAVLAFQKLTSALSWPVDNLGDIARCRASADRVLSLNEDLLWLEEKEGQPDACRIEREMGDTNALAFKFLTVADQSGLVLLESFNAVMAAGERVLITGDQVVTDGLFKATAGLWHWGQGFVHLPRRHSMAFMPRRPYLPTGTLRDVLAYPAPADIYDNAAMRSALTEAGVAWLIPRLQQSDMWDRVLTVRAQQRLSFARIFLQQPDWVIIQAATDDFDEEDENALMEALYKNLPAASVVTLSKHDSLEKHHQRKIVLNRFPEAKYLFSEDNQCLLPAVREPVQDDEVLLVPEMRRKTDPEHLKPSEKKPHT